MFPPYARYSVNLNGRLTGMHYPLKTATTEYLEPDDWCCADLFKTNAMRFALEHITGIAERVCGKGRTTPESRWRAWDRCAGLQPARDCCHAWNFRCLHLTYIISASDANVKLKNGSAKDVCYVVNRCEQESCVLSQLLTLKGDRQRTPSADFLEAKKNDAMYKIILTRSEQCSGHAGLT